MSAHELPSLETHRLCRYCKQWLTPEYGQIHQPEMGPIHSLRNVRIAADRAAGIERGFFVCYDCEARRNKRRYIVFAVLGLIVGIATLVRYVIE